MSISSRSSGITVVYPRAPPLLPQYCPTSADKVKVLRDMIFPQCERLGQTIIFVRTRETARDVHRLVGWQSINGMGNTAGVPQ